MNDLKSFPSLYGDHADAVTHARSSTPGICFVTSTVAFDSGRELPAAGKQPRRWEGSLTYCINQVSVRVEANQRVYCEKKNLYIRSFRRHCDRSRDSSYRVSAVERWAVRNSRHE